MCHIVWVHCLFVTAEEELGTQMEQEELGSHTEQGESGSNKEQEESSQPTLCWLCIYIYTRHNHSDLRTNFTSKCFIFCAINPNYSSVSSWEANTVNTWLKLKTQFYTDLYPSTVKNSWQGNSTYNRWQMVRLRQILSKIFKGSITYVCIYFPESAVWDLPKIWNSLTISRDLADELLAIRREQAELRPVSVHWQLLHRQQD